MAAGPKEDQVVSDEVFVVGEKKAFAKNVIAEEMVEQQGATSVLALVDDLAGVAGPRR